jgi:hypothetical protein
MLVEMKDKKSSRSWLRVENPKAVTCLMEESIFKYLEPFVAKELSVAEAAKLVSVKLNAMHYRAQTFIKLGLLKETRQEKRAGSKVRYYRSSADGYFIPFTHLATKQKDYVDDSALEWQRRLSKMLRQAREKFIANYDTWGFHIYRKAEGIIELNGAPENNLSFDIAEFYKSAKVPSIWASWDEVMLTAEDAKKLQQTLIRLAEASVKKKGKKRYLLRLAITPIDE